jgi:hypothetical protein
MRSEYDVLRKEALKLTCELFRSVYIEDLRKEILNKMFLNFFRLPST